jgi:hypothetical protein
LLPYGVSAIMQAAKLIDWANQKNAENAARYAVGTCRAVHPPFTTLHVGMIEGGTAHNITAKDCRFFIEFRFVPGESPDDWAKAFEAKGCRTGRNAKIQPGTGIDLIRGFALPALTPEPDGAAEALARRLTGDNGSHVVSYGTEGSQFQTRGYSTVICGPGDIAQAHQLDEFLSLEQLAGRGLHGPAARSALHLTGRTLSVPLSQGAQFGRYRRYSITQGRGRAESASDSPAGSDTRREGRPKALAMAQKSGADGVNPDRCDLGRDHRGFDFPVAGIVPDHKRHIGIAIARAAKLGQCELKAAVTKMATAGRPGWPSAAPIAAGAAYPSVPNPVAELNQDAGRGASTYMLPA